MFKWKQSKLRQLEARISTLDLESSLQFDWNIQQSARISELESQQAKLANDLRELRHKSKPGQ